MSDVIAKAVEALSKKMSGGFDGIAKFVVLDEGAIMMDASGVRAGDEEADVTLTADADVFAAILAGEMGATGAYMSGKLKIDGSLPTAMRLGTALA
ncbi:MAG: SCP2 sterol-binding domain-containing protein [Cypionkella sp.]|nr:SCP2 sterol-binding domain-containing protein [Cypionkella sp.]